MSSFDEAVIQRIKQLEREVERLQRWERPIGGGGDGWIYDTDTWAYVSATSFKIAGKNVASRFPKGTKIKLVQSGSTKYFYAVATAYSTDTTITVTGGSDYTLADAAISGQAYSYAAAPQGFPQFFNWTPIFTGFSTNPGGYHTFAIIGNICHIFVMETPGVSNANYFTLTEPVAAIELLFCSVRIFDNGVPKSTPGLAEIRTDGKINLFPAFDGGLWTTSGDKHAQFSLAYRI